MLNALYVSSMLLRLTARSCRINMSDAFSEMFPTNTVVVGPLSSVSLARRLPSSLFWIIGFCVTVTVVGRRTCKSKMTLKYKPDDHSLTILLSINNSKRGRHAMKLIMSVTASLTVSRLSCTYTECVSHSDVRQIGRRLNKHAGTTSVSNSL